MFSVSHIVAFTVYSLYESTQSFILDREGKFCSSVFQQSNTCRRSTPVIPISCANVMQHFDT